MDTALFYVLYLTFFKFIVREPPFPKSLHYSPMDDLNTEVPMTLESDADAVKTRNSESMWDGISKTLLIYRISFVCALLLVPILFSAFEGF